MTPTCIDTQPKTGTQGAVWRALRLAGAPLDQPGALDIVRVLNWFVRQQPKILKRFAPDQNDAHTVEGLEYWHGKLEMYWSRAELLGLDSPQGRQAIFEHMATSIGLAASIWRLHGPPASATDDFSKGVTGHDAAIKIE